jgi:hypothetical protein
MKLPILLGINFCETSDNGTARPKYVYAHLAQQHRQKGKGSVTQEVVCKVSLMAR